MARSHITNETVRQKGVARQAGSDHERNMAETPPNKSEQTTSSGRQGKTGDPAVAVNRRKDAESTPASRPTTTTNKGVVLTPAQLVKLRTSAKVPIFVGELGDSYIVIEGAYKDLLCHFSTLSKTTLVMQNQQRVILPNGKKKYIVFIYRWMLAGGRLDADLHFTKLDVTELVELYNHCVDLGVAQLKESTAGRIRYLLLNTFPSVSQIDYIYRCAEDFVDTVVQSAARCLVSSFIFDASSYYEYAEQWPEFNEALQSAMGFILQGRRKAAESIRGKRNEHFKATPQSSNSNRSTAAAVSGLPVKEASRGAQSNRRRRRRRNNKNGQLADAPKQDTKKEDGEVPVTARKARPSQRTRRANATRASNDITPHVIEVVCSGGGITTSAREARRGEMTRTGLII